MLTHVGAGGANERDRVIDVPVDPENPVADADGTIAGRGPGGFGRIGPFHSAAVAGSGKHGSSVIDQAGCRKGRLPLCPAKAEWTCCKRGGPMDLLMWILILPGMALGGLAQSRVKAAVMRWSKVPLGHGLTGAQVARHILDTKGLQEVGIEPAKGVLSDHYDPRAKVLRLSEAVYGVPSVAAAGIAAHEAGHAIQDAEDYLPLEARSAIVPVVKAGSTVAPLVFMGGLMVGSSMLMWVGAILFGLSSLFALVTLPVEFDASARALRLLESTGIIEDEGEMDGARKVLRAAAWTYVAAAVAAIGSWAMYLLMSRRR